MTSEFPWLDHIDRIAADDCRELRRKEETYRGSWQARGGVGAFMMLARKMDRLEAIASSGGYNIFDCIARDEERYSGQSGCDGSALAEVRDLRRYLMLVEAKMMADGVVPEVWGEIPLQRPETYTHRNPEPDRPGTPDDGGHHDTERYPIRATWAEYRDLEFGLIGSGSMSAEPCSDLYHQTPDADGRRVMKTEFTEEYGQ